MSLIELLNEKLNDKIQEIKESSSGFLSKGFIAYGKNKNYFIRTIKNNINGFEYPFESGKSFYISHLMFLNSKTNVKSYGVIENEGFYYHILDYIPGKLLSIDGLNEKIIDGITKKIADIHLLGKEITSQFDSNSKDRLYKRSFREVFSNNETLFSIYENSSQNDSMSSRLKKVINIILNKYYDLLNNIDTKRLTILHGDFWYGNILIDNESNINFIDFSRIPYGEAGIDIGRFVGNLELSGYINNSKQLLDYSSLFVEKYIHYSGDQDIINYIDYSKIWVYYLHLSSLLQSFLNWDKEKLDMIQNIVIEKYS